MAAEIISRLQEFRITSEGKVIEVLKEVQVDVSSSDIEACHRMGNNKNSPKKKQ